MKVSTLNNPLPGNQIKLSLLLVSAAGVSYQLILMQFFSYIQWHHFASIIISVALLGFGTAGTLLTIFENKLIAAFEKLFPRLLFATAICMSMVLPLVHLDDIRFDSFLIFSAQGQWIKLLISYLLLFVPFFLAACAIGLTFVKFPLRIGKLYFFDLTGAGLGGMAILWAMWWLEPWKLHLVVALLPLLAGLISLRGKWSFYDVFLVVFAAVTIAVQLYSKPVIHGSQFKDLSRTLLLPEATKEFTATSPHGVIEVVSSPSLRFAPGISLNYVGEVPVYPMVFQNGDWMGPLVPRSSDPASPFTYTGEALAFELAKKKQLLILDGSTGEYSAMALFYNYQKISALESNREILKLLSDTYLQVTDSLILEPRLHSIPIEARTFLMADTQTYDLILFPRLGSFGGMGGIEAMQENYLLTKDAFIQAIEHLSEGGIGAVTCWMDTPMRVPLRLIATVTAAMSESGIVRVPAHLIILKSWGTLTVLFSNTPFSSEVMAQTEQFCQSRQFDAILLGNSIMDPSTELHQREGSPLITAIKHLVLDQSKRFFEEYDFAIEPTSDNRPFFFQFIKLNRLDKLRKELGASQYMFLELGYAVIWIAFLLILVVSLIFIFLPLFKLGFRGSYRKYVLLYFAGIGIGFLFTEIVLIQQFILFLGQPIFAAAGVITILLISSGLGSWYSSRIEVNSMRIRHTAALISTIIIIYAMILTPILQASVGFALPIRAAYVILLIAPLGFLMGMMFPMGIKWLAAKKVPHMVPWAWGINGYFSVISALLASILAVEIGFVSILVLAGLAYALPLALNLGK